jgi:hypothetical protein
MLLQTVRDVLEFAGWYVRPCSDEGYAVAYVESAEHFDLFLFDNELQGRRSRGRQIDRRVSERARTAGLAYSTTPALL